MTREKEFKQYIFLFDSALGRKSTVITITLNSKNLIASNPNTYIQSVNHLAHKISL